MEGNWKMGDQKFLEECVERFFAGPTVKVRGDSHGCCGRWGTISLRACQFRAIANLWCRTFLEVPRSQGRGYGGGQIDVGLLPPGP